MSMGRSISLILKFLSALGVLAQFIYDQNAEAKTGLGAPALSVQMLGNRYLTSDSIQGHEDVYSTIGLGYNLDSHRKDREIRFHVWVQQSLDPSQERHLTLPQAYVGWNNQSDSFHFGVGRKLENWSLLDEEWKMGLWQALFRWDPLKAEEQGLIGLFAHLKQDQWELALFGSPVFFPDQGPQFALAGGVFRSGNRWFLPPQDKIEVFEKESPIYYKLVEPSLGEVVFHPSWALLLRHGKLDSGFWWQASYGHKPMNQLHLGVEGYRSLALSDSFGSNFAVVHAGVLLHRVGTIESGHSWDDGRLWLSFSDEVPDQSELDPGWDQPPLMHNQIYGAHWRQRVALPHLPNSYFSWSYMQVEQSVEWSRDSEALGGESSKVQEGSATDSRLFGDQVW
ncbi:MAG: hypothetical protein KDD35_09225, partial [Bdellovibrionales bacterium]|nr:hypothetical protein [Bdellovibrionales bacterium]